MSLVEIYRGLRPRRLGRKLAVAALGAFAGLSVLNAHATEQSLSLEFNSMAPVGDACRVSFVAQNDLGSAIEVLKLELVLFGKEGQVKRLLSVNVGRMPVAKTRVKQFDLKGVACGDIGRLLLNNVTECKGKDLSPTVCIDAVKTSSRLPVAFAY